MSITNSLRKAPVILGVLLLVAAPMTTRAADQAVQQVTAADANQILCRNLDKPGSHMKYRVCATLAEWSTIQRDRAVRGNSLRANVATANPAVSIGAINSSYSTFVPGVTGFGNGATQSSFQR